MNTEIEGFYCFLQQAVELGEVAIAEKDVSTIIATKDDVICGTRKMDAGFASHSKTIYSQMSECLA